MERVLMGMRKLGKSVTSLSRMGVFRSYGQLGRALGPICVSIGYWYLGPPVYVLGAIYLATLVLFLG